MTSTCFYSNTWLQQLRVWEMKFTKLSKKKTKNQIVAWSTVIAQVEMLWLSSSSFTVRKKNRKKKHHTLFIYSQIHKYLKSHQIQSGVSLIPYIHSSIALIHSKSIALTFVEIKAIYTQPKGVSKSVWFILKKRCALTQSVTPKDLEDHRIQVGDHRIFCG